MSEADVDLLEVNHSLTEGNNTTDKVYLLSLSEVTSSVHGLFSTDSTGCDKARYGKSTEYAKDEGAWVDASTDCVGNSW